jgi:hypothetical protein
MKKNEFVILSLKLLGIYITVLGLASIGSAFGMRGLSHMDSWGLYIGIIVYLVAGVILISKAGLISQYVLPIDNGIIDKFYISEPFQKAVLRIIGIYIVILAIPSLVQIAGQWIQYGLWGSKIPEYMKETPNYIIPLISQLIRFLLGLFLALGPSSIIKILGRFDKTIEKMGT